MASLRGCLRSKFASDWASARRCNRKSLPILCATHVAWVVGLGSPTYACFGHMDRDAALGRLTQNSLAGMERSGIPVQCSNGQRYRSRFVFDGMRKKGKEFDSELTRVSRTG